MEKLWAPWRMKYIGEIGTKQPEGCIFCLKPLEQNDEENLVLYRSANAFVMMNAFPYNNGHLMVAPYKHVADLTGLEDEDLLDMMRLTRLSTQILIASAFPHGFNIGINMGQTAGAGIADHIHLHIVPRWSGDTNYMPVVADTKVLPEALAETYAKLRPEFDALSEG